MTAKPAPVRLLDFDPPLEPVQFPNGHTYDVRPFGEAEYRLIEKITKDNDAAAAFDLFRAILPGVTDADLALLTQRMITAIILHARHQLKFVKDQLKNGGSLKAELAAAANTKRLKRDATRAAQRGEIA